MVERSTPLTFGRYEALFHIASGGMAEVFAARLRGPHGFEKLVAVKRLLPDQTDEQFVTMLLDEARIAANITSPHVVQTLELGRAEDDGAPYIVMELVVGVTLFDLCMSFVDSGAPTPIPEMVEIIAQAAVGLHDAHEATTPNGQPLRVVHRDVSPQNILVGVDGRVRVTDFGIARAVNRNTQTMSGQLKGKVAYMSPEQARGGSLDRRSDVFSLGIVTWEALTGLSLFFCNDPLETVRRVQELRIPGVRRKRADATDELERVIGWALERDRDERCATGADYAAALRRCLDDRVSPSAIASLVRAHGGPALEQMQARIAAFHAGAERTLMRPPPGQSSARIIPDAAPGDVRVIGPSSERPAASKFEAPPPGPKPSGRKRRDLAPTFEMEHDRVEGSRGEPTSRGRALSANAVRIVTAVGVVSWVVALVLLTLSLAFGGGGVELERPLLRAPAGAEAASADADAPD